MKNKQLSQFIKSVLPSLISILIGFALAVLVLIFINPNRALQGVTLLMRGPFNLPPLKGIGDVLSQATPILMTGLSVAFAFKTGLFNIGASGQFIVGAFTAVYIAGTWTFIPSSILWLVAFIGAALAGALWAFLVGFLKAWRNVNEVITSIMMNYIGMYCVMYLIKNSAIYNNVKNETISLAVRAPKLGLDAIFPGSYVTGSILIAIAIAILIYFILQKTTFGYELKAVGLNRDAAQYAGINERRSIIYSMLIAGALAGLAGGMTYLEGTGKGIQVVNVLAPEGFDGIAIALLAMNNPIGVIFSAVFVAYLRMGGQYMQTVGFVPEIINMMIAIILYISALSAFFATILKPKEKQIPQGLETKERVTE